MRINLKTARLKSGYTQKQLSEKLSISLVYYQKIEQGTRTGKFSIWDKLENVLGVNQRELRNNQ